MDVEDQKILIVDILRKMDFFNYQVKRCHSYHALTHDNRQHFNTQQSIANHSIYKLAVDSITH